MVPDPLARRPPSIDICYYSVKRFSRYRTSFIQRQPITVGQVCPFPSNFYDQYAMPPLPAEEYIEQAYFFRGLQQRVNQSDPIQDIMHHLRDEILATTKLPMAIEYMLAELNHVGTISTAMRRLSHYFSPYQAFIMERAEDERGSFDILQAFLILEREALYRAESSDPVGMFFYQFETLCRNRLDYDKGLKAMSGDVVYNDHWREWILWVRHQIGVLDLADLIYVYSDYSLKVQAREGGAVRVPEYFLFGEKEGRIALANRHKEPLYLFSALQRQLGYPAVPRPKPADPLENLLPRMKRTLEQLEVRIKMLEDEQRQRGIDLSQFYAKNPPPAAP